MLGGQATLKGLAILDTEMVNVRNAFAWCAQNSHKYRQVCALTSEFTFVGAYILEARLHPRIYLNWLEAAVDAAKQIGNRRYEASSLTNMALCYIALSQASHAVPLLEQALVISQEAQDRWGESIIRDVLGSAFSSLGQPTCALEQMELGIGIKQQLGDQIGLATSWANVACIYKRSGDARRAIELYEKWLPAILAKGDFRAL